MRTSKTFLLKSSALAAVLLALLFTRVEAEAGASPQSNNRYSILTDLLKNNFRKEVDTLIKIKTYRNSDLDENTVVKNLGKIRAYLISRAEDFNAHQKTLKLESFQWRKKIGSQEYWLFGFRLGSGKKKLSLISHLDTVPPGDLSWDPFTPRVEKRHYLGKETEFLVSRGALDDKGPAIVAFNVLRAVAKKYDGTNALDGLTLELILDTSEETDMATPHYLADKKTVEPHLGVVFDAMWTIRAEKGIEGPVFSTPLNTAANKGLWIEELNSAQGPTNQIPGSASALIKGDSPADLKRFADNVRRQYDEYRFDDMYYGNAALTVSRETNGVRLTTMVRGAQHGSAPWENRTYGANPLVSLAMFMSHLVETGDLATNGIGQLTRFMANTWGTRVFGENHPGLLVRNDQIFQDGNGTTYALTKFSTGKKKATLEIDVRYALGHNTRAWDGKSEGMLPGKSIFQHAFGFLVAKFNKGNPGANIAFSTQTIFTPDISNPGNPQLKKVLSAYKEVMGKQSPLLAIGGGTDAKGHPNLVAAGALFTDNLGPPVNFHGIDEGAPLKDLTNSAKILYQLLVTEVSGRNN